jgi:hypothetical protein
VGRERVEARERRPTLRLDVGGGRIVTRELPDGRERLPERDGDELDLAVDLATQQPRAATAGDGLKVRDDRPSKWRW